MKGVEYDMGVESDDPERTSDALVQVATRKLKQNQFKQRSDTVEEPIVDEMPEDISMADEMSGGLMSRGV